MAILAKTKKMVRGKIRKGAATAPPPPLLKERVKLDVSGSMHAISDSQVSDIETLCVRGEEERWAALINRLTFVAFRMGAYSRWAQFQGLAFI